MEELLLKLLEGQSRTENQLNELQNDISVLKADVSGLKTDVSGLKTDVSGLKTDVSNLTESVHRLEGSVYRLEESVHRIEHHQEENIMGILHHIKNQGTKKENQIQVLNKRLFEVETKTEQTPQ